MLDLIISTLTQGFIYAMLSFGNRYSIIQGKMETYLLPLLISASSPVNFYQSVFCKVGFSFFDIVNDAFEITNIVLGIKRIY